MGPQPDPTSLHPIHVRSILNEASMTRLALHRLPMSPLSAIGLLGACTAVTFGCDSSTAATRHRSWVTSIPAGQSASMSR